MTDLFFRTIEQFDTIAIFRHVFPDGDALGSQFGLKQWIKANYPNKKVYALGHQNGDCTNFPQADVVSDDELLNACAIVVDTANTARIDDSRFASCAYLIKIDHHPIVEEYGDFAHVVSNAAATCEILTSLLMTRDTAFPQDAATYFYCGLLTDTLQFSIPSVTAKTMHCAAFLADKGVDVANCNHRMFTTSLAEFKFEAFIKNNCQIIDGKLAYMIVHQEDYEKYHLTFVQAKDKVVALSKVRDFEMWVLFTQNPNEEGVLFNGSIRSKGIQINDVAAKYQGGGHNLASGVKKLKRSDIDCLLNDLLIRLHEFD